MSAKKFPFIPQHEFEFAAVAFNLYSDHGVDGDLLARAITEAEEAARAKAEFEAKAQQSLFDNRPADWQAMHEATHTPNQ